MTREEREEAIYQLERCIHNAKVSGNKYSHFELAIEALKAEPCEDAISREDALMALTGEWTEITDEIIHRFIKRIKALPPVTPQPKTGHWIDEIDDYGKVIWWHCDKCYEDSGFTTDCKWKYCPSCGAKMVEPQETETWNGIHAQLTAPKGTFERIFNDADDENDI